MASHVMSARYCIILSERIVLWGCCISRKKARMPKFSSYRFLDSGANSAALNMAIDEAIQTFHLRGETPPTLRAFTWHRPAISLGRFQDVEREILVEECAARGIDLVRRPTGGRAVLRAPPAVR